MSKYYFQKSTNKPKAMGDTGVLPQKTWKLGSSDSSPRAFPSNHQPLEAQALDISVLDINDCRLYSPCSMFALEIEGCFYRNDSPVVLMNRYRCMCVS